MNPTFELISATGMHVVQTLSVWAIPFLLAAIPVMGSLRGVPVYEEFVEGAKEGFETGVRIIPYLIAILVAIGMFRASGGIELFTAALAPLLNPMGIPGEIVPLALVRPLSGGASMGLFTELVRTHGPDSMIASIAGTIVGSTETTFYVLAVYFGAVGVKRTRHALAAGLLADGAGIIASIIVCRWLFS